MQLRATSLMSMTTLPGSLEGHIHLTTLEYNGKNYMVDYRYSNNGNIDSRLSILQAQ